MRTTAAVAAAILMGAQALACGFPQLGPETHLVPKTFVYENGWAIPGLEGAKIVWRGQDESGAEVVHYKPTVDTKVELQGFDLPADGKSIRLVPGYVQSVEKIVEYRVKNRTYAYSVVTVSLRVAPPPMWRQVPPPPPNPRGIPSGVLGCGLTMLRYFDADGDGRFESLEYVGFGGVHSNSTECATTPTWALQFLPNPEAATRCETLEAQRAAAREPRVFLAPLAQYLNTPPPTPVLATGRN